MFLLSHLWPLLDYFWSLSTAIKLLFLFNIAIATVAIAILNKKCSFLLSSFLPQNLTDSFCLIPFLSFLSSYLKGQVQFWYRIEPENERTNDSTNILLPLIEDFLLLLFHLLKIQNAFGRKIVTFISAGFEPGS